MGARNKASCEELKMLDNIEEGRQLTEEKKARRSQISREVEAYILQKEICWRQKSKVRWLKEADKCTKFFHLVANANRRNNFIESLIVDSSPTSDPAIVSDHIVGYYDSLFTEPLNWRPQLDNLEFDMLTNIEVASLENPFEERKV